MDHVDSILAEWQSERPDLDAMPMGVMGRLKRLQQHLARNLEAVFSRYGLNAASFDVLATLRRSGPPYALSPSVLMERTMVSSGTMTNRLDRLEAAGFISRERNPEDGRGFVIALSDKGFALIDEAVSAHVENQHRLIASLPMEDRAALDRLLAKWLAAFE
ncbi:MarR family transcriptional regulator [Martelella sp. AD-3]|uniref:MarR family winged helix-turn-helix transcriptional regulator n=1 Tax=Martelella sp. AD-3 TaxID=686597 RepID=UPI0004632FF4|nr:MarR family transcriptional regulator [Martelella sp. AD-3]AMM86373.1 transcriptional regulator [Martelella sp. AD-3]